MASTHNFGIGTAAPTGTGGPARATSLTFVTPALGTPASGTLTSCTGLPTAGLATQVFAAGIGIGGAAADTGGIAFPATAVPSADPNTLDDYEEGTWDPIMKVGATVVDTASVGTYTKIGRSIIFTGQAVFTLGGATGAVTIEGLPFIQNLGATMTTTVGCSAGTITSTSALFANIDNTTTVLHLAQQSGDLTNAELAASGEIFTSGCYNN